MKRIALIAAPVFVVGLIVLVVVGIMFSVADWWDTGLAVPERPADVRPEFPKDLFVLAPPERYGTPILGRELIRQALLLAGREELGLRTRDGSLREVGEPTDASSEQAVSLRWTAWEAGVGIELTRQNVELPSPARFLPPGGDLAQLAREAEARSREEFPTLLAKVGFEKQAKPAEGAAKDPDPPKDLTERLDLVSQFAGVRAWHAAVRSAGETPERLAGLVLAYSNLGLLAGHHWSTEPKVFQARSLLYAERLLRRTGETAPSLRVRAYARTLAGLPLPAADDLARAGAIGGNEPAPGWVAVLEARCRADAEAIDRLCDSGDRPARTLARLVRLTMAEASGVAMSIQKAALAVTEAEPSCSRGLDALLGAGMPLGTARSAQETAFSAAIDWLYEPLARSRLPQPVDFAKVREDLGREGGFREKLLTDFESDDRYFRDDGEPSLTAFGRSLEEEGFYQAWRVVATDRSRLGVNADDLIERTRKWAPHHPLWTFVESSSWDDHKAVDRIAAVAMAAYHEDLVPALRPLRDQVNFTGQWADREDRRFGQSYDEVAADLVAAVDHAEDRATARALARRLEAVDPATAATAARLVRYDGVRTSGRIPEWERQFSRDPGFLRAAADWYIERERYDDATRCLQAVLRIVPDYKALKKLADVRLATGDEDGAVVLLQEAMQNPAFALEHASAAGELAGHLMRRGRWQEALPWAERAADSSSESGLRRLAECREGIGDYGGADELFRSIAERYRESEGDWYLWCLRTGRGDVDAARTAAANALSRWREFPAGDDYDWDYVIRLALVDYLEGHPEASVQDWQVAFEGARGGYSAIQAALVADELGRGDLRDAYLRWAVDSEDYIPVAVGRALLDDVQGVRLEPDSVAQTAYRCLSGPGDATHVQYFLGRYLETHQRTDEADRWYGLAASSPYTTNYCCLLASAALLRRSVDTPPRRLDEVDRETTEALRLFGEAVAYAREERFIAARLRLDRTLALAPGHVGAMALRSQALLKSGRTAEALRDIEAAVAVQPDNGGLRAFRAQALDCAGRHAEAIAEYESLIPLAQNQVREDNIHMNLCWVYAACEDPAVRDPVKAVRHVEAMHPENGGRAYASVARMEAVAYAAAGNLELAVKCAEGALREAPFYLHSRIEHQLTSFRAGKPYVRPARWWMLFDASDAAEEALSQQADHHADPIEALKPRPGVGT